MPSKIDDQLAGKYKGVSFLVRNEKLNNVGQTRVKHSYPKSSIQYMEPMGEEPFDCTIDLFFSGVSYKADFQKFQKAIQNPAPGRLFSPEFGVFNSVVALPGTFSSDQKKIGEISASINFLETISKPSPIESNISEEDVSVKAQESREELLQVFSDSYLSPSSSNNLLTSKSDAVGLAEALNKIVKDSNSANEFLRKINQSIRIPTQYASILLNSGQPIGYLQSVALSFPGVEAFNTFKSMSVIGSPLSNSMNDIVSGIIPSPSTVTESTPLNSQTDFSINIWDENTAERIERNTARFSIVNTFRLVGLIGMYEATANKSYTTTDEIIVDTLILDNYYETLIENDTTKTVIPGMKSILDKLRALTNEVLLLKKQQAYTVIEIEVIRPISAFLLAYDMYGEYLRNDEQHVFMADLIANLNRSLPRNRLNGIVRVVEIGR